MVTNRCTNFSVQILPAATTLNALGIVGHGLVRHAVGPDTFLNVARAIKGHDVLVVLEGVLVDKKWNEEANDEAE